MGTIAQLKTVLSTTGTLLANGAILSEDATLEDYGIVAESTIQLVHPVLGGGRKRKKKVYTTPKKIKHKRMKLMILEKLNANVKNVHMKLAVLVFSCLTTK